MALDRQQRGRQEQDEEPAAGSSLITESEKAPPIAGDTPLYLRHWPSASILACRILRFEDWGYLTPASEQLLWLHQLHVHLDSILRPLKAEKVELSGDLLQFISGTENGDDNHANTLVTLARELLCLGTKVRLPNGAPLEVQMGLHSGECVTSVVGSHALKYSVFGAAAAVAAELERLSAPGQLRMSAATKRLLKGDEQCVHGGRLTLWDFSKMSTYLLTSHVASGTVPEQPHQRADVSEEGGVLLGFSEDAVEQRLASMRETRLRRLDAAVCGSFLAATAASVAILAARGRILPPGRAAMPAAPGTNEDAIPLQLALGTLLAWLAALGVALKLPTHQQRQLREPVCVLLRVALSVHRVQSIYTALPGTLPATRYLGTLALCRSQAVLHALPVLLLSLLLVVRMQKHVVASLICAGSEALQLWDKRQGISRGEFWQHMLLYTATACLLPSAMLYVKERRARCSYAAAFRR